MEAGDDVLKKSVRMGMGEVIHLSRIERRIYIGSTNAKEVGFVSLGEVREGWSDEGKETAAPQQTYEDLRKFQEAESNC